MASETVDPTDWPLPPELHVFLSSKAQDLLQREKCEHATFGMPGQRTACAATQDMDTSVVERMVGVITNVFYSMKCVSTLPSEVGTNIKWK